MKPNYFDSGIPDRDDVTLLAAKDAGVVPRGCLLGGVMVEAAHALGEDPCAACPGDRVVCGGRPLRVAVEAAERDPGANDSEASRRIRRERWLRRLDDLVAPADENG